MHMTMANSQELQCQGMCQGLQLRVQGQLLSIITYTLPLESYDLILET